MQYTHSHQFRHWLWQVAGKVSTVGVASIVVLQLLCVPVFAEENPDTMLSFRPHCIFQDKATCPTYQVMDAEHLQTPLMRSGDILDIDIVLATNAPKSVSTVRSWLKYDPTQLEARSVEIFSDALPQPIPGEQTIDATQGIIKIGGGTDGKLTEAETRIGRVTFRIVSTTMPPKISFHGYLPDGTGETAVLLEKDGQAISMMQGAPPQLLVDTGTPQTALSSSTAKADAIAKPANTSSSVFRQLQVQGLRLTSSNQNIFVGWTALPSSELAGYNVYYGTVSGKYIQRRSLDKTNTSLILRNLEPETTYFVAVRAYNASNEESTFGHEESVQVGKPETSTAPLSEQATVLASTPRTDGNPLETRNGTFISGETGIGTEMLALVLFSAVIGTVLAWHTARKRQSIYAASSYSTHHE